MIAATAATLIVSLAGPAALAHGSYTPWKTRGGGSCCNDTDCRPADICVLPDGLLGLTWDGACRSVDGSTEQVSPDGRAHICVFQGKTRCHAFGGMS